MAIKRINFQSIPIEDQDRAIAFYKDHLGFEVQVDAPYMDGWRWIFMTLPGAETRLHFAKTSEMSFTDTPALCLVSDDVDADSARFKECGIEITNGPDDAPWAPGTRWLMIRDSENNLILLESFKEAPHG